MPKKTLHWPPPPPTYLMYGPFRYLNFCLDFYDHIGKRIDKKAKVNFKYITSQTDLFKSESLY